MGEESATLSNEILGNCLGNIEKTVDGQGYAFTKLDASSKDLSDLGNNVEEYKHLRHVVVSNNRIVDLTPIAKLPDVLTLNAGTNAVESLECFKDGVFAWCQIFEVSMNKLTTLPSLASLQRLRVLDLHGNEIASMEAFGGHPQIEHMRLEQNKLTSLEGFGTMPKLKVLDISENELTSLAGLDAPVLDNFNLSKNQLAIVDGITGAPAVKTLNLSGNQLAGDPADMAEMKKLTADALPGLQEILVDGNPMSETFGDGTRLEVLICVPTISIVDGAEITDEEREQAQKMKEDREAAAAAAAEAAAAAAAEGGGEEGS